MVVYDSKMVVLHVYDQLATDVVVFLLLLFPPLPPPPPPPPPVVKTWKFPVHCCMNVYK